MEKLSKKMRDCKKIGNHAVITIGRDGIITGWNTAARTILGWSELEALGQSIEIFHTEEDVATKTPFRAAVMSVRHGQALNQRWYKTKKGQKIWCRGCLYPLLGNTNRLDGFILVLSLSPPPLQSDTSPEKLYPDALRKERKKRSLEAIKNLSAELVAELDPKLILQRVVDTGILISDAYCGAFFYQDKIKDSTSVTNYAFAGEGKNYFKGFDLPLKNKLFSITLEENKVFRSDDVTTDTSFGLSGNQKNFPKGHPFFRSYIGVPVVLRSGKIAGALFFGHPNIGVFDAYCEHILIGLAGLAAIALETAHTFLEYQQINQNLEQKIKERTKDLAISEARARAYFETSTNLRAVFKKVENGFVIIDVNPVALETFKISKSSTIGMFIDDDYSSPENQNIGVRLNECLVENKPIQYEETKIFPEGDLIFETTMIPIVEDYLGENNCVVLVTSKDVTEARRTADQLRQSQKMEAVGQLTGGIAHDFNNLLAGIIGSLEMIASRAQRGSLEGLERFIDMGMTSANRAASLTHRLLAFSRRQTLDPKVVDIYGLTKGMEDLIGRTVGPAINFQVAEPAEALQSTLCDPNQLESALLNLAINARDAMPDGGDLTITCANEKIVNLAEASHLGLVPGDYVTVAVADTGEGMSKEVAGRAFDPFFTTKPLGQGTGLGLSMVYGFSKQSGGHARIISVQGRGTTVKIYLPVYNNLDEKVDDVSNKTNVVPIKTGKTILLVDDENIVRSVVAERLESVGYTIIQAHDGQDALMKLEKSAEIDLLITDVGLPNGMNGRQLADEIRRKKKNLPVLFMTGYIGSEQSMKNRLDEKMLILIKPFQSDVLLLKIAELLDNQNKTVDQMV